MIYISGVGFLMMLGAIPLSMISAGGSLGWIEGIMGFMFFIGAILFILGALPADIMEKSEEKKQACCK